MAKELDFFAPAMDTVTLSEAGVSMPVLRPDRAPLLRQDGKQVEIVLYGPDSAAYRMAARKQAKFLSDRAASGERTDEQKIEDQAEGVRVFLTAMTKSWNVTLTNDTDAPCDEVTVMRFYKAFPDAAEQADRFIGRRASFTKAS